MTYRWLKDAEGEYASLENPDLRFTSAYVRPQGEGVYEIEYYTTDVEDEDPKTVTFHGSEEEVMAYAAALVRIG